MRVNLSRAIPAALAFLVPLAVYIKTSYPAVAFIDSGELAVVCQTLGIAHPTGYPLYTLLGKTFTWLPFGTIIARLNLLSALFVSGAVLFFCLALGELFLRLGLKDSFLLELTSLFLSLHFAFTSVLWSQATTNEVYGLNVLFLSMITFLILRWDQTRTEKPFYLTAFILGLTLTNHMSGILLLPALLFFFWSALGRQLFAPPRLITAIALILLAVSLYLYLPVRSALYPLMDWSHPVSWHNFKSHITGWQYQVWMFGGSKTDLLENLANYWDVLLQQFPIQVLIGGMVGLVVLLAKQFRIGFFLLLLILFSVGYGINYSIPDIDSYFLPSFLAFALLVAGGMWFLAHPVLVKLARLEQRLVWIVLLSISILLAVSSVARNFQEQDKSQNFLAYDMVSSILNSVSSPALILTDVWDYYSPYLYIHFIEKTRPEVIMLDKELLRRSWYYNFIRQAFPEVYRRSRAQIKEFVQAVYPFEHDRKYDPVGLEAKFQNLLASLVENDRQDKGGYAILAQPESFLQNFAQIPEGMASLLVKKMDYFPYQTPEFELRGAADPKVFKDGRTRFHLKHFSAMLEARARYEAYFGFDSLAAELDKKARQWQAQLQQQ